MDVGLFWTDVPYTRNAAARFVPPVPESEWVMPTEFPDLRGQGLIAIDIETYDPDLKEHGPGSHRDGYICGVAVGTGKGFRQYYPVAHQGHPNLDRRRVFAWLSEQLGREGQPKVGANLLYDLEYLKAEGVAVAGPYYDIQVAEPLLDENQLSYSLENIARRRLGESKRHEVMNKWLTRAFGAGNIKGNIYRAPPNVVGPYAEGDVDLPLRIFARQEVELKAQGLWELFLLESRLVPLLLSMRERGVRVDTGEAERLREVLVRRHDEAMTHLRHLAGHEVNIWAADSIAKMFDEGGQPYERTGTGKPSFRKDWLERHPWEAAKLLVEARRVDKFRNTFVEGYILEGHVNGRLYTQFHQLRGDAGGTVSGRLSSSTPNLQNIPIRDPELGPLIRNVFVPDDGCKWWKVDWSQIEFRLAVHYAGLLRLQGASRVVGKYHEDRTTDYHQVTAELTGLPRAQAKSINFGIVYGLGTAALCVQLGITRDEGMAILDQYHRELPFVKPLYTHVMYRARRMGIIKTLAGRQRRFNQWTSKDDYGTLTGTKTTAQLEAAGELKPTPHDPGLLENGMYRAYVHKALNALLQGSAADIMKTAMVQIHESGIFDALGAPHLTVHDELDGSLPDTPRAREALHELMHIMETCVPLQVPLLADLTVAESWGKTKT